MKKKATPLEQEYDKEVRRIEKLVKRQSARGFSIPQSIKPTRPKKITKASVAKLQKITKTTILEKSTYYDPILAVRVSGVEGEKILRSRAARKGAKTRKQGKSYSTQAGSPPSAVDSILNNIEDMTATWQPLPHWDTSYTALKTKDKNILSSILTGAINELGREQVARNLEENATLVKDLAFHICYGSSDFKWQDIQGDIAAIAAIIRGRSLSVPEAKELEDIVEANTLYEDEE